MGSPSTRKNKDINVPMIKFLKIMKDKSFLSISPDDGITIKSVESTKASYIPVIIHTAKNRDGFAIGAIIAAEWIIDKKGIFNLKDILK